MTVLIQQGQYRVLIAIVLPNCIVSAIICFIEDGVEPDAKVRKISEENVSNK